MTKTLTEQWRDNDLADDKLYYWRISDGQELVQNKLGMCAYRLCNDSDKIECLAPVPSYDKVKEMSQKIERLEFDNEALEMAHNEGKEINAELVSKTDELVQKMHILEKKLEIATKALKSFIPDDLSDGGFGEMYEDVIWDCKKALKEMEGVK